MDAQWTIVIGITLQRNGLETQWEQSQKDPLKTFASLRGYHFFFNACCRSNRAVKFARQLLLSGRCIHSPIGRLGMQIKARVESKQTKVHVSLGDKLRHKWQILIPVINAIPEIFRKESILWIPFMRCARIRGYRQSQNDEYGIFVELLTVASVELC